MKILSRKNIIIASIQPWYSPMVSKQFLALELAKLENNIVFLNLRRIIKDSFRKGHSRRFKFHDIKPERVNVKVLKVPPGFLRMQSLYLLTKKSLRHALGSKYYPDIIISFDPQFYILHEVFQNALKIYYCADHMVNDKIMEKAENKIFCNSDIVIAASKRLYEDLRIKHFNVNYIPHGVDLLEQYENYSLKNQIKRWFEEQKNKPVFGFVGSLNSAVDFKLIESVAKTYPTSLIALIGPISKDVKSIVSSLPSNVFCPGQIPTIGLKYCLAQFDVGIVPYKHSRFNSRRNPIKVMQYIASGLPVVSTEIGEDFGESKFVYQCATSQEFNQKLMIAHKDNSRQLMAQRIQFGKENSWSQRVELLDEISNRSKKSSGALEHD